MTNLFAYGSLMFDEVWEPLMNSQHTTVPATLAGYVRYLVRDEHYPGIRPDPLHSVSGIVIFEITSEQLKTLDEFEGHYYQRDKVNVITTDGSEQQCDTYIFKPEYFHLLSNDSWSAEDFEQKYMKLFIERYPY